MNKHKKMGLLFIVGITLIVSSTTLQLLVTINAWRQERTNKWAVEIPLNMSSTNTYAKSFTPKTPYYGCHAKFTMRGPVIDEFADYRSISGGNVPDELIRNMFSQMPFKVSWRLLDGEKEVCSGAFQSSDICVFVYPTYVYYTYSHYSQKGLGNLEPYKDYSFIGNVEQPCESLNQLNPKLLFKRGASFKARGLATVTLFWSVPVFFIGVIFLGLYFIKNKSEKEKVNFDNN